MMMKFLLDAVDTPKEGAGEVDEQECLKGAMTKKCVFLSFHE